MKKLFASLMLVAFTLVSGAAYAQDAQKKDETKKEEKKEKKAKKKKEKKEEKKEEKKPS